MAYGLEKGNVDSRRICIHQFNKLAADDIFDQIDCVHVWILDLTKNEHLEGN